MVPFRMSLQWVTSNTDFNVTASFVIWRWISQKRYKIETRLQWTTNRDLHITVVKGVTLSDPQVTRNIQWHETLRGLCATAELLVYLRQRRRYMFLPVFVCLSFFLSVSKLSLFKNACMDFDEMLRVDRCRDMDKLINFWARSGS